MNARMCSEFSFAFAFEFANDALVVRTIPMQLFVFAQSCIVPEINATVAAIYVGGRVPLRYNDEMNENCYTNESKPHFNLMRHK